MRLCSSEKSRHLSKAFAEAAWRQREKARKRSDLLSAVSFFHASNTEALEPMSHSCTRFAQPLAFEGRLLGIAALSLLSLFGGGACSRSPCEKRAHQHAVEHTLQGTARHHLPLPNFVDSLNPLRDRSGYRSVV